MRGSLNLFFDQAATAAAEMALVAPLLIIILFGSVETGNYFLSQHAVSKQVRDGARFASRLPLANYTCPTSVVDRTHIVNVTETGSWDGAGVGRFPAAFWNKKCGAPGTDAVSVTLHCLPNASYAGVWAGSGADIPVVTVSADVSYASLFGVLPGGLCMHATSEAPVSGL